MASPRRIVLTGGTIVDGTGAPARRADLVIEGSRILEIVDESASDTTSASGGHGDAEVVDCTGLTITPGFIDIHTHSDLTRLRYADGQTRAVQGVTTEVTGNCGLTPFPVTEDPALLRSIIGPIDVAPDVEISWRTTEEYLEEMGNTPGGTNIAPLIGHASLRLWAMGSTKVVASDEDLERMREELDRSLIAGVWGMSLGLMYAPSELADHRELSLLATEVARHGAFMSSHMRAYAANELLDSVTEIANVVRDSGVGFQISHLRSIGDTNAEKMTEAIEFLESTGLDIEADAYPYLAGQTTMLQLFPPEVRGLGTEAVLAYIDADPEAAAAALGAGRTDGSAITVAKSEVPGFTGLTFEELAAREGRDWATVAIDLLVRSRGAVDVIVVGSTPADTMRSLGDNLVSIASDGVSLDLTHSENLPHPRSIGTFPRAIQELLEYGLPLETIIHKATGKPARRMGLTDRGTLAAGNAADIVVMDPSTIRDNASYAEPLVRPSGVHHVMVNGEVVLRDSELTGRRPGTLLLKTANASRAQRAGRTRPAERTWRYSVI